MTPGGVGTWEVPPTVTLDVWRLPATGVPGAMAATVAYAHALRSDPRVRFAKVLGTSDARFTARGTDLARWALLTVWHPRPGTHPASTTGPDGPRWTRRAGAHWQARLVPLRSRGRWSGVEPFDVAPREIAAGWTGPVLALTRARLRPQRALPFWRAVPPVAGVLPGTDGLQAAFGVGEAPVGVQGTVSVWRDTAAVVAFARRDPAHRDVVARTPTERWYAEELFARLAVVSTTGSLPETGRPVRTVHTVRTAGVHR